MPTRRPAPPRNRGGWNSPWPRDAGRIATRDARLDYTVSDAASGNMTVSIAFTYAGANGSRTVTTQRLLPRRQWQQLAFDNATQAPDEGVYIRIDARR